MSDSELIQGLVQFFDPADAKLILACEAIFQVSLQTSWGGRVLLAW